MNEIKIYFILWRFLWQRQCNKSCVCSILKERYMLVLLRYHILTSTFFTILRYPQHIQDNYWIWNFVCFAFCLVLLLACKYFSSVFTVWGKSYTAVLFHCNCRENGFSSSLPDSLPAGGSSCWFPTPPAASRAVLDLAEVWYHSWEKQPMRMALLMSSEVLDRCTRTVLSTWKYSV